MDEKLGKYRLINLLATGGMGEVFLARQEGPAGFSKTVVVKRILRHLADDQSFVDMFVNEARLAAQLQHPNVVQIFELGLDGENWFIAMEYVHGRSLHAAIEEAAHTGRRIDPRIAARVVAQALQALHFAHQLTDEKGKPLGILHRDVSPDNVLVSFAGGVKLVDFGIAKAMNAMSITRMGSLKGKYSYMAPEQFVQGSTIDARTDLYAMGVVLHEMLTNERPAQLPKSAEEASLPRGPFVPRGDLPPQLNEILRRALAPDARERWANAEDMGHALEQYIQATGDPITNTQLSRWLTELFGTDAASANPAVAQRNSMPVGGTDVLSVPYLTPGGAPEQDFISSAPTMIEKRLQAERLGSDGAGNAFVVAQNEAPVMKQRPSRLPWLLTGLVTLAFVVVVVARVFDAGPARAPEPVNLATIAPLPIARPVVLPPVVVDAGVEVAIAVEPDAGTAEVDDEVPTSPTQPKVKRRPLRPGKVTVRVNPWAEVFYGGRNYGTTPVPPIEVPAGNATFTLRNKQLGVTRKITVKVPPGEQVVLKADLFKGKGG